MDPITAAIIAGIAAGATSGATDVVKQGLVDAYNGLKRRLLDHSGNASRLARVIQDAEEDPESKGVKLTLEEQVARTGAAQDPVIVQAAQQLQALIDQMQDRAGGGARSSIGGSVTNSNVQTAGHDAVSTGGGAYTRGDVNTGGDFIGRDRIVHGDEVRGPKTTVGNITGSQGIAIGTNASAVVTSSSIGGEMKIDPQELRTALQELYTALTQAQLPVDKTISAQSAVANALGDVKDDQVDGKSVAQNVQQVGETLKQANTVVEQGSSLWQSVQKLAPLLGPMVGGARIVAQWFGIPL